MKRNTQAILFVAMASLLVVTPLAVSQSGEQELVLEEGLNDYEGTRDTSLYSENQNTNGGGQHIFSGFTVAGAERRALIAFDLNEIPAGSQITSARLQLQVSRTRGSFDAELSLHRLNADWGEGEADAGGNEGRGTISADGDATWQENFKGESSWDTPGGDFVTEASATAIAGAVNTKAIFESTDVLVADVQSWVDDPESNFGWIILSGDQAKRFHSSDNSRVAEGIRPQLIITYIPGSE